MKLIFTVVMMLFSLKNISVFADTSSWQQFSRGFEESYRELALPPLQLSYIENLEAIRNSTSLSGQESFFLKIQEKLKTFDLQGLSDSNQLEHELIDYEVMLNLERLDLAKHWLKNEGSPISTAGISTIPIGKQWYAYYVKRWVDAKASPEGIYAFGLAEVKRVSGNMTLVKKASGLKRYDFQKHIKSEEFFYNSSEEVKTAFIDAQTKLQNKLPKCFPYMNKVTPPTIAQGTN